MASNDKDQKLAKLYPSVSEKVLGLDTTKPCRKCGSTRRTKPRPGRKTGACVDCTNAYSKRWEKKNPQRVKEIQQKYKQDNIEEWKESKRRSAVNYKTEHPDKVNAHYLVKKAIRKGQLPKVSTCTCADCGIKAREYHHEDYSKPLEVVALCRQCHIKRHTD